MIATRAAKVNNRLTFGHTDSTLGLMDMGIRTNGRQGGDAGHGGYLSIGFFSLILGSGATVSVEADGEEIEVDDLKVIFKGDQEITFACDAILLLAEKIKALKELDLL